MNALTRESTLVLNVLIRALKIYKSIKSTITKKNHFKGIINTKYGDEKGFSSKLNFNNNSRFFNTVCVKLVQFYIII